MTVSRIRCAALLALSGCGRLGFDESGRDARDLGPDAPPNAVVLQPVADTYLCPSNFCPGFDFGDATDLHASPIEVTLVQFELTVLPPQPVQSATLRLHGIGGSLGSVMQLDLHRLIEGWNELVANWQIRYALSDWTTMGGTYAPAAYATSLVYSTTSYLDIDITSLTNEWLTGTANDGAAIVSNNAPSGDQVQFASREHAQPELRPTLIVVP